MNINATVIGQSIAFLFFLWFCMQYIWPPIINALNERRKKIADGIQAANQAEKDLEETRLKVRGCIDDAKLQAQIIVDNAEKRATQIIDIAKNQAKEETDRIKKNANNEIDQDVVKAKEKLSSELSSLVVIGAEKILAKKIDDADNEKIVDDLLESFS